MSRNLRVVTVGIIAVVIGAQSQAALAQAGPQPPVVIGIQATRIPKIRVGDVSDFEPAVAAVDSGGRCVDSPTRAGLSAGERLFLYAFDTDGKRTRSISVVVDSLNQLVRYSDGRGHLTRTNAEMMSNAPPAAPMTMLTVNAVQGFGMIENRGPGVTDIPMQVKMLAFLDAPNLGVPRDMIAHVLRECAGGR